ncbi:uncharacterized protein DS421_10g291700 [Arachis hypogaea]|nr:uncharacterized protein DS421_10g291700 [Arachis hypogaea]
MGMLYILYCSCFTLIGQPYLKVIIQSQRDVAKWVNKQQSSMLFCAPTIMIFYLLSLPLKLIS